MISRVSWKYWPKYEFTLTSYGPAKVEFALDRSNNYNPINELSTFIASKSTIGLGKLSIYDKINAKKRIYMDSV